MLTLVLQVAALLIVAGVLFQIGLGAVASVRRFAAEGRQQRLAVALFRERVEAARRFRRSEHERQALTWNGYRKFVVGEKTIEARDADGSSLACSFKLTPHDGRPLGPYLPGQYLTFQLRLPGTAKPTIRCYSLSDAPHEDHYRVTIKRVPAPNDRPDLPAGLVSSYFHDVVEEGDILDVQAPRGEFHLDPEKESPTVLVAGGIGVTPLLSMLNSVTRAGSQREIWFFYGVRHGAEQLYRQHLERLAREHPHLHLRVCYSAPRDADALDAEHHLAEVVSVGLFRRLLPSNNYDFYLCGPPPMMEQLTRELREWNVPDSSIHFEAFGPASVGRIARESTVGGPFSVTFARSGKQAPWDAEAASLLELAEAQGIVLEAGCRAGNCGTCVTAVRSGEVEHSVQPGARAGSGNCLACVAVPASDVVLDA